MQNTMPNIMFSKYNIQLLFLWKCFKNTAFYFIFKYKFIYFNWRLITLQYCTGGAIHQHESAAGMNFIFFSRPHKTFSRIEHILGHKSSLGKFKKIEIIPSIFSDHNTVRLDLNYRRKTIKNSNIWRLNNMLLNNQQITE